MYLGTLKNDLTKNNYTRKLSFLATMAPWEMTFHSPGGTLGGDRPKEALSLLETYRFMHPDMRPDIERGAFLTHTHHEDRTHKCLPDRR